MTQTKTKLSKWLKFFIIIAYIGVIGTGLAVAGNAAAIIFVLSSKKVTQYKIDGESTLLDLFEDNGVTSRGDLAALISTALIYSIVTLIVSILLLKWLKSTRSTLEPFSDSSTSFMRKSAKFIYIACIIGTLVESIILGAASSSVLPDSDYTTLVFEGLAIHFLAHIFAYANEKINNKAEAADNASNVDNPTTNNDIELEQ